jgi:hypothetical protein
MSDDVEFQLLTRSLVEKDFARGVVAVDRRGLLVAAACLGLLALTVFMTLTNTASLVISLTVVGVIALEVARLCLREFRKESR